jgi:uncharacterized protein YjbI with pentapeptide repeats
MLNQLENHQDDKREFDDADTEKQHIKRSERYIPSKNWLSKFCKWADFGNKTLWEILQLIGLPTVVTVLGLWINYSVSSTQKEIEAQKYQQTALENYINAMTEIIVKHDIFRVGFKAEGEASQSETTAAKISQTNTENVDENILTEELKSIAKAKTLTTLLLLKLDPDRRDLLLYFLREANLLCLTEPKPLRKPQEVHLLQGIKLVGANLSGADLKQADLQGTNLVRADLRGAILAGADLRGVTLNHADLREAQLNEADLSMTTTPTFATYVNLEGANLRGANLQGAILNQANLKEADLNSAPPSKKHLEPTPTNLSSTQLRGATLHRAKLQGANLQNARLEKPILSPEAQKKMPDEEKRLFRKRTDLREANLQGADLTNANLTGADLTGADLRGATLKGTTLKDANLSGANLQDIREGGKASDLLEAHLCNTTMWDGDVCNRDCWWSKLLFWRKSPHSSG